MLDLDIKGQADSNPGPHDQYSNALTTKPAIAAAESTGNLCYLCTNLINVYCSCPDPNPRNGVNHLTLTSAILH